MMEKGMLLGWVLMVGFASAEETTVPVTISEGHETDRRDGGRPIVLIAAALEVKPETFREAFSGVKPAHDHKPTNEEAQRNKEALMKVLQPFGITNDRLDAVSNYYRYQPQKGQLWTNVPAKAHAVVEDGKIKSIVVDEPGAGYSSTPKVTVEGMDKAQLKVTLTYDKDLKKNGSIKLIEVSQ